MDEDDQVKLYIKYIDIQKKCYSNNIKLNMPEILLVTEKDIDND